MRRRYAFMINVDPFPNLFLVEMSRRTNLGHRQVSYFEPNVTYCPPSMNTVLEDIQNNLNFFDKYWSLIKQSFFRNLSKDNVLTMEDLHSLVLDTIISLELITLSEEAGIRNMRQNTDRLELIAIEP